MFTTQSGSSYDGNFVDCKPHGDCIYKDSNGREAVSRFWNKGIRQDEVVFDLVSEGALASTSFMNEVFRTTLQDPSGAQDLAVTEGDPRADPPSPTEAEPKVR